MSTNLIIVESPTKAKTISQFLGKDFKVESSYGHIRDLPKSKMGVEIEQGFQPQYVVPTKSRKKVNELKKMADKAQTIYYATDEDREGEAIAWHLDQLFGSPDNAKRIAFHEVTKSAIFEALKSPRKINQNLVNAQQARRILDRLVGYELSPFLWKKVAKGLSAGRVQSVAVRLVVEREREIKAFVSQEYWTIEAIFSKDGTQFSAVLHHIDGKKLDKFAITNEKQAREIVAKINGKFKIAKVEQKETTKNPPFPFTTSTLQQRANRMLGFSAKQTMVIAQQLYEGINLGPQGSLGLITYMRTDSLNLSNQFLSEAQKVIEEKFGREYAQGPKKYQAKSKLAQEAHEAIRPTNPEFFPESLKEYLDNRQFKLYDLIWRRSLASQMPPAKILNTAADITDEKNHLFRATGSVITFDGFLKALPHANDKEILPVLKEGEQVKKEKIEPIQHFTEPLPRYSEAALIKVLEEHGIGRPSTYAPTIATIQDRNYVTLEEKKLKPTDIGFIVNDLLVEHFPNIVDYQFTAKIEDDFDEIAHGKEGWTNMLKDFYKPFHQLITDKSQSVSRDDVTSARELGLDPESKKPIYVRMGRYGPYVQKGSKDDAEKPEFASLRKGQNMDNVTLADALKLFSLPRVLGKDESGQDVIVNRGRYGPYVKIGENNFSIKGEDPFEVTLARALEVIKEQRERKANKNIKEFEGSDVKVLNGRYGPYITDGQKNARIPKDVEPASLTLDECQDLLNKAPERKRRPKT